MSEEDDKRWGLVEQIARDVQALKSKETKLWARLAELSQEMKWIADFTKPLRESTGK